ncbi:glycoside hydrolase family 15 protein [Nocardia sp. NPDC058176]|uniref:glycoside hydrolase family 15 protein n=1 Tax=Nocardia sp. NPDC058176 TaxID=3346368 RepID=UPI0036D8C044
MSARLEDYALIGDMQTAALVARTGTIDWLCLPRFDSPAVFAGLLGTEDHGCWRLGPVADGSAPAADRRRYRPDSLILEQEWDTPTGSVRITDFMPPRGEDTPQLIRLVQGLSGRVRMRSAVRARFAYGRVVPWVQPAHDEHGPGVVAIAGPDAVWFSGQTATDDTELTAHADFEVAHGEQYGFAMTWQPSHLSEPPHTELSAALATTVAFWSDWVARCTYRGPYREAVVRSLITLKALTYAPTGAIVAAPTTSLPEDIGGVRNWDYRYTWLRDAAITLSSLLRTGYRDEARDWRNWLLRAVAGDPENLQIMYGIAGERELTETILGWLPGYENSAPVRIGNTAAEQFQLDVYGEVVDALTLARTTGLAHSSHAHLLQLHLIAYLERHWREPDEGIWEVRGPRRHFVHSKVMTWVAVDRTITLLEEEPVDEPLLTRWRALREEIHRDVCEFGYDPERNTFTQAYGSPELDASLLLIPHTGFLPPEDKRVIGTIEAIQRELLTPDGFVLRYRTHDDESGVDGLPGQEGSFLACSFWLADDLALIGRIGEAHELFDKLLAIRNDVGLLAEEWDPRLQRQVGNFPQAFSHVPLIDTALRLSEHRGEHR